jgi:hypothetical protein
MDLAAGAEHTSTPLGKDDRHLSVIFMSKVRSSSKSANFLPQIENRTHFPSKETDVMKISELAKSHSVEDSILYGIEVDEELFTPPNGLRVAGLLWQGDAPDQMSDLLVDTLIAFSLSGVEIIIEVRPEDDVDHGYLLTLAGNAGFSVAAIPPTDEAQLSAWCDHCAAFARALLQTPNFSKSLIPATGYLTYLIAEKFAGVDALAPTDPYILQRFVEPIPEDWSDKAKVSMRKEMTDMLGGESGLEDWLGSILNGIYSETQKYVEQAAEDMPDEDTSGKSDETSSTE